MAVNHTSILGLPLPDDGTTDWGQYMRAAMQIVARMAGQWSAINVSAGGLIQPASVDGVADAGKGRGFWLTGTLAANTEFHISDYGMYIILDGTNHNGHVLNVSGPVGYFTPSPGDLTLTLFHDSGVTHIVPPLESSARANTGILRDAAGRAQVAAPSAAADIARKFETDAAAAAAASVGAELDAHIGSGGTNHAIATESLAGFMSAADKAKLNDVQPAALKVGLLDYDSGWFNVDRSASNDVTLAHGCGTNALDVRVFIRDPVSGKAFSREVFWPSAGINPISVYWTTTQIVLDIYSGAFFWGYYTDGASLVTDTGTAQWRVTARKIA